MRISLNLATRPFADLGPAMKRLRIAMASMAGVAILLGVGLHAIHNRAEVARARDHSLDGQISHIEQERVGYQHMMEQPPNAQLLKQAAVLNKLIDEKAFSWTLAMEDLETVLPAGVQVSTLAPERQKDGRITVHLKVIGPRNRAVDLVRNLEHSKRFLLPRIVGENSESNERPGEAREPVSESDRVDFDLLADYNPSSLAERTVDSDSEKKPVKAEKSSKPAKHLPSPRGANGGRPPYVANPKAAKPSPLNEPAPGGKQ
jgi:type IV pilus assembly protein PilN